MAKKLQLVFKTAANTTSTVSIENAKEGLTLDEAKTAAAKRAIKNLNYNQIKLTATEAQLLEAGTAIAGLTQYTLSGIRVIDTSELSDAT